MARTDLLARANNLWSNRTPFVFATVVKVERPASAKGLITVGNPCLSGGTLDIFLEVMSPPMLVHVFGDSPIARSVTALGEAMGWDVRPTAKPDIVIAPDTATVVVASHGGDEERVLMPALRAGVPYVGLVASRRRGSAVIESLDVEPQQRERLHSPAGLDIGAHGPDEAAVSILAEIIASRTVGISTGAPRAVPETQQAVDPVRGMTVAATSGSHQYQLAETTRHFCGPGCRDAFAADPGRYST